MESKKKVIIVSSDIDLHRSFSALGFFSDVTVEDTLNHGMIADIIIVSDRVVTYNSFVEYLQNIGKVENNKLFFMISSASSSRFDAIKPILTTKGVTVIPPKLTSKQIIERVCVSAGVSTISNKNVFAFFGADSKVGTSSTVQAIAETLTNNTKSKVCLLNLSGQPGIDYFESDSENYGLDNIKVKIMNGILSSDELYGTCFTSGNLSILPTSKSLSDIPYFLPENIEKLVSLASDRFDVVLVDGGSNPMNSGLYIGVLNSVSNRYLITTQQESTKRYFEIVYEQVLSVLDISTKDLLMIVNKYQPPEGNLNTSAQLADQYKINFAGQLKYSSYSWQAERDHKSLIHFDSDYAEQIGDIAKALAHQLNIDYVENVKKRKFFDFLNKG